jgi:hypothetical protein
MVRQEAAGSARRRTGPCCDAPVNAKASLALALAAAYVAHTTIGLLTAEAGFPLMISAFRLELVDLVDLHLIGVAKIS